MRWSTGIALIVDREDEVLAILRTALQSTDYVLLRAKTADCQINGNRAGNVVGHSQTGGPTMNIRSAEVDRHRVEFMKSELTLCFTFSTIAARRYESGDQESATKSTANAEKAYETVIQFLSDPKHSKHLTAEESQDITIELERLRDRLDRLIQRFTK